MYSAQSGALAEIPLTALARFDTRRGRHVENDATKRLFAILQTDHLSRRQDDMPFSILVLHCRVDILLIGDIRHT